MCQASRIIGTKASNVHVDREGEQLELPRIAAKQGGYMLILTRRVTESVKIGPDITVVVLGVKGRQVRIGIDAPKDVAVHREEIVEKIMREGSSRSDRR